MREHTQLPIQQSEQPNVFESFFHAETYLEINGYECNDGIWFNHDLSNATVVAKPSGVEVIFENTH